MPIDLDQAYEDGRFEDLDGVTIDDEPSAPLPVADEEPVSTPAAAAEPDDVAAAEEFFGPSWFDNLSGAMSNPNFGPEPSFAPAPAPAPQWQQPPQPMPPGKDPRYNDLDSLFDNPRDYVNAIVGDTISRYGQISRAQMQGEVNRVMHANATNAMYAAKQSIDRGYNEVLNKDNSFRSNKVVRDFVDGTLQELGFRAANAAFNGDFSKARMFDNPNTYAGLLALAKQFAGVSNVTNKRPAVPAGAVGERVSQRRDSTSSVKLPADLEMVAQSINRPGFREQLEKEYAEAMKRGDLVWKGE